MTNDSLTCRPELFDEARFARASHPHDGDDNIVGPAHVVSDLTTRIADLSYLGKGAGSLR